MENNPGENWFFETIEPEDEHTHTLIFLHGLGDKGQTFLHYFGHDGSCYFSNLKVLLPTASRNKSTCNNGNFMNSWFDIFSLGQK